MASAPASDRRRGLRRAASWLMRRLRPGGRPQAAGSVSADVVGGLPVRPSWPMLTILRRRRLAARSTAPATPLVAASKRPLVAAPAPLVRPGRLQSGMRTRRLAGVSSEAVAPGAASRPALVVRPGHDLPVVPIHGAPTVSSSQGGAHSGGGAVLPGSPAREGVSLNLRTAGLPVLNANGASGDGAGRHMRSLVARPVAGPTVQPPSPAGDLPVLGSTPLPPGAVPDPSGAVHVTLPVASPAASPALAQRLPARPGTLTGTPRQRWEAAVSARPLEAPRTLPGSLHALARSITGRPHPPRFTTGPATRHALAATGALGATTGSVVHLAAVPTAAPASAAVLAHELAHVRRPVRRPRFLLAGASSLVDDDEREALTTGLGMAASQGLLGARALGAGIVDRLPVGAGLGAAGSVGSGLVDRLPAGAGLGAIGQVGLGGAGLGAAGSVGASIVDRLPVGAGLGAAGSVASIMDRLPSGAGLGAVGQVGASIVDRLPVGAGLGAIGQVGAGLADRLPDSAGLGAEGSVGAGIVDRLPVGGGLGAVGDVATRAARAAIIEATATGSGFAGLASGGSPGAATSLADTFAAPGMASQPGSATDVVGLPTAPAAGGPAAASQVSGQRSTAEHGGPTATTALDADRVVEIVEQRLLREIERRGGRWAGVF